LLFFAFSFLTIGIGVIMKDISPLTGLFFIAFFTTGAFIIGGYHDPDDPNPQD